MDGLKPVPVTEARLAVESTPRQELASYYASCCAEMAALSPNAMYFSSANEASERLNKLLPSGKKSRLVPSWYRRLWEKLHG